MHLSDSSRFISVVAMRRAGLAFVLLAACGISGFIVADEFSTMGRASGFDTNALVRYESKRFGVEREDWVATDALATTFVKKIEAGRVSYVTITKTATGTYSSDAMFSKHVQYPGISVSEHPGRRRNHLAYWAGDHWNAFTSPSQSSLLYFQSGSTRITCVFTKTTSVC